MSEAFAEQVITPRKRKDPKHSLIPPLTCVKEDVCESEPSFHEDVSPSLQELAASQSSAERKGFFAVKQPSLVSTGTYVVPETLTVSPE